MHTTLNAPAFNTVTVTAAEPGSAFSTETVSKYSYVVVSSTSSGTSNVGVGPSVPAIKRSVFAVFAPRRPDVFVVGTHRRPRSRALQIEVFRAFVHQRRRRTRNSQRTAVKHRNGHRCRRVFRILSARRQQVLVCRRLVQRIRHVERRRWDCP